VVPWLSAAAFIRCLDQTFPQLFQGLRRPLFALYDAILSLTVVSLLIAGMLWTLGGRYGALSVAWAWLLSYPLLIGVLVMLTRVLLPVGIGELFRTQKHSVGSMLAMAVPMVLAGMLTAGQHPALRLLASAAPGIAAYALYVRHVAGIRVSEALSPKRRAAA
jgi:hypothetical protein